MARPEKLKDKDRKRLVEDIATGLYTVRQLADKYNIGVATVLRYKDRKKPLVDLSFDEDQDGFLYVFFIEDSAKKRYYKIGIAKSVEARMKQHQVSLPFVINIALSFYVKSMKALETKLIHKFKSKRISGEWFDLTQDDVLAIKDEVLVYGIQ